MDFRYEQLSFKGVWLQKALTIAFVPTGVSI
jgi:hypothetical protein